MRRQSLLLAFCFILTVSGVIFSFHFSSDTTNGLIKDNSITAVEFYKGTIFAGTKQGLYIYNPDTGFYKHVSIDEGLISNYISALSYNKVHDYLVIGTGGGISLYKNNSVKNYSADDGLFNNDIRNIYTDPITGNVFVSCFGGGVCTFNSKDINQIQFSQYMTGGGMIQNPSSICVSDFFIDPSFRLWHGTNGSGYHILNDNSWITYNNNTLSNQWITGLEPNLEGNGVLVSTTNGMYKINNYDPEDIEEIKLFKDLWIYSMATDANAVFVASRDGLLLYLDGGITNLSKEKIIESDFPVSVIAREGAVIVATQDNGVYVFNNPVERREPIVSSQEPEFDNETLLVSCKNKEDIDRVVGLVKDSGFIEFERIEQLNALCLRIPGGMELELAEKTVLQLINNNEDLIDSVKLSKNPNVNLSFKTSDPYYLSQQSTYLQKILLPEAREEFVDYLGKDVVVAVLDTGVNYKHPELNKRSLKGKSFDKRSKTELDEHGHGTHCAGIIGAESDNKIGICGVAPQINILPVKCLSKKGSGTLWGVAQAIIYATDQKADIISMSLGGPGDSSIARDAVKYAWENGVLIIAAAGNSSTDRNQFPSAYPHVLSVASIDFDGELSYFSNYGPQIDVSAPGENIFSTFLGSSYANMSGTSMACPHVAGLAGLIKSVNYELTNADIASIILSSSLTPDDSDDQYGQKKYTEKVIIIKRFVRGRVFWTKKVIKIPLPSSSTDKDEEQNNIKWTNEKGFGIINIHQALKMASEGTTGSVDFLAEKQNRLGMKPEAPKK